MGFIKKGFIISLIVTVSSILFAETLYTHTLKTKQAIENIRFISNDSKYTYFQKNSGELSLSANFSTRPVFKDTANTHYIIHHSNDRLRLIVTKDKEYYSFFSPKKELDIFVIPFGEKDATYIGKGRNPKLHLRDSWITYFSPLTNILHFQEIEGDKRKYQVMLQAPAQSFHSPDVVMINDRLFVYTDLDGEFLAKTLTFYPQTKQKETIYQAATPGQYQQLCLIKNQMIISEFSKTFLEPNSVIMKVDIKQSPTLKALKPLYNQATRDLGRIHCLKDRIYFLKERATSKTHTLPLQDIFSVNYLTAELLQHTSGQNFNQIFDMDGRLMTILSGEFVELLDTPPKIIKRYKAGEK